MLNGGSGQLGSENNRSAEQQSRRRICILIVDDDAVDRMGIKKALDDFPQDLEILEADRLEAAADILKDRSPDCMFLDYLLPDGSSLTFLEELRADLEHRYLGIVLITGKGDEEVATAALRLGAQDYLPKDRITSDRISDVVTQALADMRLKREVDAQRQVVENFAALLVHDLRDPLAATRGFLQLALDSRIMVDSDRENVSRALEGANYAIGLVNELMQYARNGSRDFSVKAVSLDEVLAYARDVVLQSQAASENTEIDLRGPFPWIEGNFEAITLLFQNLLQNGVKYRKPDETARIVVTAGRVDGFVEISVRDNGRGIDKRDQDRIFQPLTRGRQVGEQRGYGLGLATCVRVVNLFDGEIRVNSEPGEGAEFIVSLPMLSPGSGA